MVLQIRLVVVVVVVACSWRGVGVINTHELGLASSSHHHHLLSIWTPLTASADSPGTFWDRVSVFVIIFNLPLLVSVIIGVLLEPSSQQTADGSLRSRHMEIMSARKNEPREGNTRGEKELCTSTEMIPTIEMISATEMTPNHHRNDPHHRNDTGGHHRNDPRNIGNGIKRTTKTGQQFSACFLFILFILHLFYGV